MVEVVSDEEARCLVTDRCTGAFLPWEKRILQEVGSFSLCVCVCGWGVCVCMCVGGGGGGPHHMPLFYDTLNDVETSINLRVFLSPGGPGVSR